MWNKYEQFNFFRGLKPGQKALVAIIVLFVLSSLPILWYYKKWIKRRLDRPRAQADPDREGATIANVAATLGKESAPKTYDTNL